MPIDDEHRTVLDAIVRSDDPSIRATDRLRALEMLQEGGVGTLNGDLLDAACDEIQDDLDRATAVVVADLGIGNELARELWPETARVLGHLIAQRARAEAFATERATRSSY